MARAVNKLSARTVATITKPGRHSDGNGLYLVVDPSGAKRWLFLFRWGGKLKEMGLGGLASVTLQGARLAADAARKNVQAGHNPIEARKLAAKEQAGRLTFGQMADRLIPELAKGFRGARHAGEWTTTLRTHAASLRDKPLDEIRTDDVLEVLQPIWATKASTAAKVRGRIERVLDAAKARGLRTGDNPARWRGHLDQLLSKRPKLQRGHLAAMPFGEVPSFVADLRKRTGVSALALEFLMLTAARTSEVFGVTWREIDAKAKVWTVPASRMKAGREHRVPLSDRALEILAEVEALRGPGDFVFPGARRGRPLNKMAIQKLLVRMKVEGVTTHGFRSSFRDWAGEATAFPRDVAEAALAHAVGDETERAYRRGDALEKRRKLMDAWARFIGAGSARGANVVPIGARTG